MNGSKIVKNSCKRASIASTFDRSAFEGSVRASSRTNVAVLRASLGQAWNSLRPECQTIENRDAMAAAIVRSATYGERDPVQPVQALKAITPEATCGAE